MRVTTKGQATIPKEIRDRLGIGPGSEVDFIPIEDGVRLVAADSELSDTDRSERFRKTLEAMTGTLDLGGMTTDEYMEWLRGPRERLDLD